MIQVSAGQSLLDICLQELGSLDPLYELADANSLTISEPLRPGQLLQVPTSVLSRPAVVAYFSQRRQRLNSGAGTVATAAQPEPGANYFNPRFFNPQYFA